MTVSTNTLVPYQPSPYPKSPEGVGKYIQGELQKISQSLALIIQYLVANA